MKLARHLPLAVALLVSSSAHASPQTWIAGVGSNSCGKFLADEKADVAAVLVPMYVAWSQGLITAMNFTRVSKGMPNLKQVDGDSIAPYLEKYCRDHPLDKVADGAVMLIGELSL